MTMVNLRQFPILVLSLLQVSLAGSWILSQEKHYFGELKSHLEDLDHESSRWLTTSKVWPPERHTVNGIECREIPIDLPVVGTVIILEATAEAQNTLVDLALTMDDDQNQVDKQQQTLLDGTENGIQLNVGDPYGAVLWPAASAVATCLLQLNDNNIVLPEGMLKGLTIVELGAGTGLISLAALKAGAKKVIAVDYESLPLQLLQYAAQHLNPPIGSCQESSRNNLQCYVLDLEAEFTPQCQQLLDEADVLVAADILYQPSTGQALAKWIVHFLKTSGPSQDESSLLDSSSSSPSASNVLLKRVLVGDSPGRPGRPVFLQELQRLGVSHPVFYKTVGRTCSGPRHELICGPNSSSVSESPQDLEVAILELNTTSIMAARDK